MKILKTNIKILGLAAILLTAGSCSSDFLETSPTDSVGAGDAVSTPANLLAIINGMHRDMYVRQNSSQGQSGQAGIMLMMEAAADDVVWPSNGNNWYLTTIRWQDQGTDTSSYTYYPYQFYYALIHNANIVIGNADKVYSLDPNTTNLALGEALAYRAFCYYNLVQFYGGRYAAGTTNSQLGVPLRLDESTNPIPRNTVEEVYKQINADLQLAITKLTGITRPDKSHFNVNIVKGLVARVALTQGNYALAAQNAKEARAGFALMDNATYTAGFNDAGNGEWMWGTIMQKDQSDGFGNFSAYMSRNFNSTQIRQAPKVVNTKLFNAFPATDVRTKVIDPTGLHLPWLSVPDPKNPGKYVRAAAYSAYSIFPYTSQKFMVKDYTDATADVPYMRSAEMYLIEAEARAMNNDEAGSKAVFNELQKNRNPSYAGATTTGPAYVNEVLNSRRLELWGEGFRWFDLKRLNQPLDRTGTGWTTVVTNSVMTIPVTDKRWQWQIPRAAVNASGGVLVQNPLN